MEQVYKCPTCESTKTIHQTLGYAPMSKSEFIQRLPEKLVCYYQGCEDYCIPVSGPLNEE